MHDFLALDLGGTKSAALLGRMDDASCTVLAREEFPTRALGAPEAATDTLFSALEAMAGAHGFSGTALGISCGGPLDERSGRIMSPPNMPGWDDVPIAAMAARRFGIPVRLMNDANAGCLAEVRYGAGRGCRNAVFMTMGTGMGAGMVINGRIYEGASGMAGEAGHVRLAAYGPVGYGKLGSFEGFCSGGGIAQLARHRALEALQRGERVAWATHETLEAVTAKSVAEAAHAGDALARSVFEEIGSRLGQGLSVIIDLINPEIIMIGGIFMRCSALLVPSMDAVIAHETLPAARAACRVVPAKLGEEIGDIAALCAAWEGYHEANG